MTKNPPPKLTWDLEMSLSGELLPSPECVAFEVAAWSCESKERGVEEDTLATSSPGAASFSLDEPKTNWVESSFGAGAVAKFC